MSFLTAVAALIAVVAKYSYAFKNYANQDLVNDTIFCEIPALPKGTLHIVIAGYQHREIAPDYSYLYGLTNTEIFHYRRQFATLPVQDTRESCGVEVKDKLLLPNRGREAAAFFDYAYSQYFNPPELVAFLHGHVAISWHTTCNSVYSRILLAYRDTLKGNHLNRMITLSGNHKQNLYSADPFPKLDPKHLRRLQLEPEDQTIVDGCHAIFTKYNTSAKSAHSDHFYSCCATFIIPGNRLHWYPKELYLEMRNYHLTTANQDMVGRYCFELLVYEMFSHSYTSKKPDEVAADMLWYDRALNLSKTLANAYGDRLHRCYEKQAPDITD